MGFISSLGVGFETAKSDTLTIIGRTSASIDEWGVEPMNIEVHVVNEKAFTNSGIAVVVCINVESINLLR